MLEQLLSIVRAGGAQTTESLARQLGVTPKLVEAMLADLGRRGYVVRSDMCDTHCVGCDAASQCSQQGMQRLWTVRHK
jgi:DNA-binding IclR family transcriptional regulator